MLRDHEAVLLALCQKEFVPMEWIATAQQIPAEDVAVVACYLAGTSWYGHTDELASISESLRPGSGLPALMMETGFSPSRFRGMLQHQLHHARHP